MMNRFSAKVMFALLAFCFLTLVGNQKAMADSVTLELVSTGSNSAGGYDAYPYFFSVNGGPATTPLMCISYDNEIYFGETWTATVTGISGAPPEEAGWLLNDANLHPGNADADQLAAWSLFANNVPMDSAADTQLGLAEAFVTANPTDPSFYDSIQLYTPVSGSQSEGGYPQTFLGESGGPVSNTVTPEPTSLVLLGSGLLGFAGRMYRRKRLV
jgi:hypothetical protein